MREQKKRATKLKCPAHKRCLQHSLCVVFLPDILCSYNFKFVAQNSHETFTAFSGLRSYPVVNEIQILHRHCNFFSVRALFHTTHPPSQFKAQRAIEILLHTSLCTCFAMTQIFYLVVGACSTSSAGILLEQVAAASFS